MTSLGLLLGTTFEPRNIGLMFGFVVLPLTFLGGTYYQWTRLAPVQVGGVHWLQILVLINPLIYVAEGMRAGLTEPHTCLSTSSIPCSSASRRYSSPRPAELPQARALLSRPPAQDLAAPDADDSCVHAPAPERHAPMSS